VNGERLPQAKNYIKQHKKLSIWHKLVLSMAAIVVFVTTYMLILPAITMESKLVCGITEHIHTEECYSESMVLACSDGDYAALSADDTTSDGAVMLPTNTGTHIHTDECYKTCKVLSCGIEEHTHTDECYKKDNDDEAVEVSDEIAVQPGDLTNCIVEVSVFENVSVFESQLVAFGMFDEAEISSQNSTKYDADKEIFDTVLQIVFKPTIAEIETAKLITDNGEDYYYFEYVLPEEVVDSDNLGAWTLDESGEGKFRFQLVQQDDGQILLKVEFYKSYVDEQKSLNNEVKDGEIHFNAKLGKSASNENGDIRIETDGKVWLDIPASQITYPDNETADYDISVSKSAGVYNKVNNTIEYTVKVVSQKGTPDVVNVNDVISVDSSKIAGLECESIEVNKTMGLYNSWGSPVGDTAVVEKINVSTESFDSDENELSLELPKLESTGVDEDEYGNYSAYGYEIKYTYKVDIAKKSDGSEVTVNSTTMSNKVTAESPVSETLSIKSTSKADVGVTNVLPAALNKSGSYDSDGYIKWTIKLDGGNTSLANGVLKDEMFKDAGSIAIYPGDGNAEFVWDEDGNYVVKFDHDSTSVYQITYSTPATTWNSTAVSNTATFGDETATGTGYSQGGSFTKNFVESKDIGSGLQSVTWQVNISIPSDGIPAGEVYDGLGNTGSGHYISCDDAKKIIAIFRNSSEDWTSKVENLRFRTSTWNDYYTAAQILNGEVDTDIRFTEFSCKFNEDVLPEDTNGGVITFTYTTTVDTTEVSRDTSYSNTLKISDRSESGTYNYNKKVLKMDGENSSYTSSKTITNGVVTWIVKVILPESCYTPVNVVDTLPEQVKLDKLELSVDNKNYNEVSLTAQQEGISFDSSENQFGVTNSVAENKVTTAVQPYYCPAGVFYLRYTCSIDESQYPEAGKISEKAIELTNNVEVTIDDEKYDTASQTQNIKIDRSSEAKQQLFKDVTRSLSDNRLDYSVKINPDGVLYGDDETYEFVDTLTYENGYLTTSGKYDKQERNIEIDRATIKLYYATCDENGEWMKGDAVDPNLWSYQYSESSEDKWSSYTEVKKVITAQLPNNGKSYILEYTYVAEYFADNGSGDKGIGATNSAEITNVINAKSNELKTSDEWSTSAAGGSIGEKGKYAIYKISKDKNNKYLEGAVFRLYEYSDGEYVDTQKGDFVTDTNGYTEVNYSELGLKPNTLYRIVEVKPPVGYELPETPEYLYFYMSDSTSDVNNKPSELPENCVDLASERPVKYIENAATSTKSINLKKVWRGVDGTTEDNPDFDSVFVDLYRGYKSIDVTSNVEKVKITCTMDTNEYSTYVAKGATIKLNTYFSGTANPWVTINYASTQLTYVGSMVSSNSWLYGKEITVDEDLAFTAEAIAWASGTYTPDTFSFAVEVVDGEEIVDTAYDNYEKLDTYEITKSSDWQATIEDLPTTGIVDGEYVLFDYYVEEQKVKGYESECKLTGTDSYTITNTKLEKKLIKLVKTWLDKDGNTLDDVDADKIVLQLYRKVYKDTSDSAEKVRATINDTDYGEFANGSTVEFSITPYATTISSGFIHPENTLSLTLNGETVESNVSWGQDETYSYSKRFVVGNVDALNFDVSLANWPSVTTAYFDIKLTTVKPPDVAENAETVANDEYVGEYTLTSPWVGEIEATDLPATGTITVDGEQMPVVYRYYLKEVPVTGYEENPTYIYTNSDGVESENIDLLDTVDANNIVSTVEIKNKKLEDDKAYELPSTGGTGTTIYTIAGAFLVLFAVCCLYIKTKNIKCKGGH
jgi:LPXTG-motif cell wall-anchored protein